MTFPTRRRGARKWSCHGQSRNCSRIVAPARSFTIGDLQWGQDGDQLAQEGGSQVLHLAVAVTVIFVFSLLPWVAIGTPVPACEICTSLVAVRSAGTVQGRRGEGEVRDMSISHVIGGRRNKKSPCGGERKVLVCFDREGLFCLGCFGPGRYPLPCWSPH